MECWKKNFTKKALKDGIKNKNDVSDVTYDGYSIKANVNSFDVELVMQDNVLYDFSCSCSKKSSCAHEAAVLYFFDEFPEILEDLTSKEYDVEKISKINLNDDFKIVSSKNLKKFLKKEFKKNPKVKYDFIKYFEREPLIDNKEYEKKLRGIITGKRHGYYDLRLIGGKIKTFMKNDIQLVIDQKEYELAYTLLNKIMDIFIDQIYWGEHHWYDIAWYYNDYCELLIETGSLSENQINHIMNHLQKIAYMGF